MGFVPTVLLAFVFVPGVGAGVESETGDTGDVKRPGSSGVGGVRSGGAEGKFVGDVLLPAGAVSESGTIHGAAAEPALSDRTEQSLVESAG